MEWWYCVGCIHSGDTLMIEFIKSLEPWFPEVTKFDFEEIAPQHLIIADRNGELGLMVAGNVPEISKFDYGSNTTWGLQLDTYKKASKRVYCYWSKEVEQRFPWNPQLNYGDIFAYGFYVEGGKVTFIKRYHKTKDGVCVVASDSSGKVINTKTEIDCHIRHAIKNQSLMQHIRASGLDFHSLYRKQGNQGYVNIFG
jgi:hypothetical protein